jgi:hypothetical protein
MSARLRSRTSASIGSLAVAILLAAPVVGPRTATLAAQTPLLRAGVDMVLLNVTATDRAGQYVTDLEAHEFAVFENGQSQNVGFLQQSGTPLSVSLMIDVSDSLAQSLPHARKAAMGSSLSSSKLEAIHTQIKAELSSQYLLAYRSTNFQRSGTFLQVAVRVERPGVAARTRPGYFAPQP